MSDRLDRAATIAGAALGAFFVAYLAVEVFGLIDPHLIGQAVGVLATAAGFILAAGFMLGCLFGRSPRR